MIANKTGSRRILKSDLARVDTHVIGASEYKELPELDDEMLGPAKRMAPIRMVGPAGFEPATTPL